MGKSKQEGELTDRQRMFVEHYLQCWNASEAARRAGYAGKNADVVGPRMLVNVGIQALKKQRIEETAMGADEVLLRLAAHARGNILPFLAKDGQSIDIKSRTAKANIGLLKKYKVTKGTTKSGQPWTSIEIELHDAQSALIALGKHLALFTERQIGGLDAETRELLKEINAAASGAKA